MTEIPPPWKDIAPSVQALLTAFHQDTWIKQELAPTDSTPVYQCADGTLYEVDEDGWLIE
ncbi:hypothetical protein ACQP0C_40575 [Nocardia sp. CA-129566]|uniref:hypothetical protein n=1 Tax=Nocardia sp. CA-129566 TaxID=3239976 RepID=UPI003D95330D